MLKAVLFDLDHTLIDWGQTEPWETYQSQRLAGVFEYVRAHLHPLPGIDADIFFTAYVVALTDAWKIGSLTLRAPDIRLVLVEALAACGVPQDLIDSEALLAAYDWRLVPGECAFPDVPEVLPVFPTHGIDLGIVTNASHPMHYRDRELEALGLLDLFSPCRVAAVDVGYLKPHRAIFERALAILDIRPDEAVFVGDNLAADVGGAQAAGMIAVWRARQDVELQDGDDVVPDGTISTLHDLLPLLDGWYPGWRNGHTS